VLSNLIDELDEIKQRLTDLETNQQQPSTPPAQPTSTTDIVLYYTSTACVECRPIDDKIESLQAKGYPIVSHFLTPTEARVRGVPRLYIPSQDKHIAGISNVSTYLALLLPR
jgi:hypothetical protein